MMTEEVKISQKDMRLLLSAASPDAALMYLYLKSGNELKNAPGDLQLNESRLGCAEATLRQLGLLSDDRVSILLPGNARVIPSGMCWKPWTATWISAAFTAKSSGCWAGA